MKLLPLPLKEKQETRPSPKESEKNNNISPYEPKSPLKSRTNDNRLDKQNSPLGKLSELKNTYDDNESLIKISVMENEKTPDDTPVVVKHTATFEREISSQTAKTPAKSHTGEDFKSQLQDEETSKKEEPPEKQDETDKAEKEE